ncbi:hypothetical protein PENSPDRAFT_354212 [Peniophora sp. CONT]|nr:hypothetical protein PENSPDRAFT_354212 [Peniophora sp. CONT]
MINNVPFRSRSPLVNSSTCQSVTPVTALCTQSNTRRTRERRIPMVYEVHPPANLPLMKMFLDSGQRSRMPLPLSHRLPHDQSASRRRAVDGVTGSLDSSSANSAYPRLPRWVRGDVKSSVCFNGCHAMIHVLHAPSHSAYSAQVRKCRCIVL